MRGYSVVNRIHDAYEQCLKQVLRTMLEREPTIKDAKDCTLFKHPSYPVTTRLLMYKKYMIGRIDLHTTYNTIKVVFTPNVEKKQIIVNK